MADHGKSGDKRATQASPETRAVARVQPFTWADPGTWPASLKFLPAYIALLAIFVAIYYNRYIDTGIDLSSYESCVGSFNYSFRVNAALSQAHTWSINAKEIGYAYEATQQIYNPERSVFGPNPFPGQKLPGLNLRLDEASLYIQPHLNSSSRTLFDKDDATASNPAALGVAALQFSRRWGSSDMLAAATRQKDVLLKETPRHPSGAISHQSASVEVRSDAVAMVPPFLAYYGVANDDLDVMREAIHQIGLYREILSIKSGPEAGLWKHMVRDSNSASTADASAWSTGNAWAAYGMARTRATVASWSRSSQALAPEIVALDVWIGEILDAIIRTDDDPSGLLRNYIGDSSSNGEASGTALLAATAYRMAVMRKDVFTQEKYLHWAHQKRRAVLARVDDNGFIRPVANPALPSSKEPIEVSPEGQSFLLLLGTAWRDCVCSSPNGICLATYMNETQSKLAGELSFESLTGHSFEALLNSLTAKLAKMANYFKSPQAY